MSMGRRGLRSARDQAGCVEETSNEESKQSQFMRAPMEPKPDLLMRAIFEDGERDSESAFRSAVDLVNNDPAHSLTRFRLAGVIQRIPSHDAFHARKAACKLLSMGVMAIVGPSSGPGSAAVDAACKRSRVPHLVTRAPGSGISDGGANTDGDGGGDSSSISIRVSPRRAHLGSAIKGLLDAKGWKSFTLVYEDSLTILRLREVLRLSPTGDVTFRLRQCAPGEELRKVFREVGRRGESNILLDAPTHRVKEYLKQLFMSHLPEFFVSCCPYAKTLSDLQESVIGQMN
nr:glutamate receptor ionotropic, kainate 3-like [Rhipicephalus microplus]